MSETDVGLPLTEARRDVLYAVRRRGEATVDEVATRLDITVSGARQHLQALEDAGLVAARTRPPSGRGRPSLLYRVTDAADGVFPKAYGDLTNELLEFLDDDTEAMVFDRRRDRRIEAARARLEGLDLPERVAALTEILDADGYMASWEQVDDTTYRIVERNCAIASVAAAHPLACLSELEFIRAVLPDATVERTHHIVAGATECGYLVAA